MEILGFLPTASRVPSGVGPSEQLKLFGSEVKFAAVRTLERSSESNISRLFSSVYFYSANPQQTTSQGTLPEKSFSYNYANTPVS